jgi:hypothetical protein
MKLNVLGLGYRCITTLSASFSCGTFVLCCGLSSLSEGNCGRCTRGDTSSGQLFARGRVTIILSVVVWRCSDRHALLLCVRLARTLVLLFVVLSSTASDEDIDAGSLVVETRVKLAFRKLTNKIVDLSALIALLQGNGLDFAEVDGLSRVLEIERELLLCIALEHREETLRRIEADGHEGGTVRVVDSR